MANVLLVTKGTGGDLVPFLGMGSALRERGHDVTLFTHCCYADTAARAGLDFVPLDTPKEFERFIEDGPLLNTPRGIPVFFERHVLDGLFGEYERISERCNTAETVLVARHMSDIAVRMAAEALQRPFVRVFVTVAQIMTIPFLAALYGDILALDINRIRKDVGLSPVDDWHAWLRGPDQSIATWPEWFAAPDATWSPGIVPVGFITHDRSETGEVPSAVQEMLDADEPPILVTGGTGPFMASRFYEVAAAACHLLGSPAILVTRFRERVPEHLPDGVCWFPYLPFASVMPHVRVVVHHGGMSTLARAIATGVPQLALPYGADRPDTSARLQRLGGAEFLLPAQWKPETVAEALKRLIESSQVRERCQELARRVRHTDSKTSACEAIEEVVYKSFG
jgi:rhamnosyltransferase subunit B